MITSWAPYGRETEDERPTRRDACEGTTAFLVRTATELTVMS